MKIPKNGSGLVIQNSSPYILTFCDNKLRTFTNWVDSRGFGWLLGALVGSRELWLAPKCIGNDVHFIVIVTLEMVMVEMTPLEMTMMWSCFMSFVPETI